MACCVRPFVTYLSETDPTFGGGSWCSGCSWSQQSANAFPAISQVPVEHWLDVALKLCATQRAVLAVEELARSEAKAKVVPDGHQVLPTLLADSLASETEHGQVQPPPTLPLAEWAIQASPFGGAIVLPMLSGLSRFV